MADYEQLEKDICVVLCPKITTENGTIQDLNTIYTANPLPDNESEINRSFAKPIVYVVCTGSDYDSPENLDIVVQNETINFECLIRSKTRLGISGIFSIIIDIKSKLLGFKLGKRFTKIRLIKNGYIDSGTQNDWNYMLSFSTTSKVIENLPEPTYPKFVQIDLVDK